MVKYWFAEYLAVILFTNVLNVIYLNDIIVDVLRQTLVKMILISEYGMPP